MTSRTTGTQVCVFIHHSMAVILDVTELVTKKIFIVAAENLEAKARVNAVMLWHGSTLRTGSNQLMNYRVFVPVIAGGPENEDIVQGLLLPTLHKALKVGGYYSEIQIRLPCCIAWDKPLRWIGRT